MTQKFKGTAGGNVNWGGTFLMLMKVTADGTYTLNDISFTIGSISVAIDIRACLWSDNAGTPDKLKDWSAKTTYSTTGDKVANTTQGFILQNGVTYWIGLSYVCSSGQINFPADTSRINTGYQYEVGGTCATDVRDSPVLNYVIANGGGGGWVNPGGGGTAMIWADVTVSSAVTFALDTGQFTLTGNAVTLARGMALGSGDFRFGSANGEGKVLFRTRHIYSHPADAEPLDHPRLQSIRVGAPSLSVFRKLSSD